MRSVMLPTTQSRDRQEVGRQASGKRRGSTLLIVLTLMGLLALLGVLFYTFAAQARATATAASNESRVLTAPALEPDSLLEYALEQLILGPDDTKIHSALWGGRHSLIPNMLGRDGVPFSGEGVHVIDDSSDPGSPAVDLNYNDSPDNDWLLGTNDSPAANGGNAFAAGHTVADIPGPDVGYTYPDINNMFLSYRALVPDFDDPAGPPIEVLLPSFHRPGLLPRSTREVVSGAAQDTNLWFGHPDTGPRIFRPHLNHRYIDGTGTPQSRRFVFSDPAANQAANATTLRNLGLRSFFPRPPVLVPGGIPGEQGYYQTIDGSYSVQYGYDLDLDGDGIRESVLLDLDFPPQRRGDGKLVVPMFGIHVVDANGLINLNAAGNLEGNISLEGLDSRNYGTDSLGNERPISASNQGFSTAEINPVYALSADPDHFSLSGGALTQHAAFLRMFGVNAEPRSREELANLEWLFLNVGRLDWNPSLIAGVTDPNQLLQLSTRIVAGRFGEYSRLRTALGDLILDPSWTGGGYEELPFAGISATDDNLNYMFRVPPLGTPIDPIGRGNPFRADGLKLDTYKVNQHPVVHPVYHNYDVSIDGGGNIDVRWYEPFGQQLMRDSEREARLDEVAEFSSVPGAYSDFDAPFPVEETAALHLGSVDQARTARASRVLSLASANFRDFSRATGNNPDTAQSIRQRFTTLSRDRREFAFPGTNRTEDQFRQWESSPEFPPRAPSGPDPFRAVVRRLLGNLDLGNPADRLSRFRLNVNEVLTTNGIGELIFRPLTDYEDDDDLARRDRQRLARDIYVLLYYFCGGRGTDANVDSYSEQHARAMAQFAVNIVDAIDADDIITEFWYDPDLSDGWNDASQRVFGVERQQLAFTEGLALRTPNLGQDNDATMFSEMVGSHDYLFVELMNVTPFNVNLYPMMAPRELWRLRRDDADVDDAAGDNPDTSNDVIITLRDTDRELLPGGRYVIASQDGTVRSNSDNQLWSSEIRVRSGGNFPRIIPGVADTGMVPTGVDDNAGEFDPAVDLDLCHSSHQARFLATIGDASGAPDAADGALVQGLPPGQPYRLRLERRARGYRDAGTGAGQTNGWAIVDKIDLRLDESWSYMDNDDAGVVLNSLNNDVQAQYRRQPLRRGLTDRNASQNTLRIAGVDPDEENNSSQIDVQLHFDRPLMSVGELLHIPVFAPRHLTNGQFNPLNSNHADAFAASYLLNTERACGGAGNRWYRLLNFLEVTPPFHRQAAILNEAAETDSNLLTFLPFPLRLPRNFGLPWVPGQVSLNAVRHPQVLAGLLDDSRIFNGFSRRLPSQDGGDEGYSNPRSWWQEFLYSRDGIDEVTSLPLPGTSVSNPFRGLGHLAGANSTMLEQNRVLQSSVFRALPADVDADPLDQDRFLNARRLFEIGSIGQHQNRDEIDAYARYRLYHKLANNSTLRSNTFVVYVGVQFHEAAIDNTGSVRIGGRLEDTPLHRGFFIIDRTDAIDQVRRLIQGYGRGVTHDPANGILKPQNLSNPVEFYSYRALSSPGANDGIDWRSLIKFRQLLN